jgi:alpha-L-fucosidase 2
LCEAETAYHFYRVLLSYVSPDEYRGPDRRTGGGTYPNLLDAHSPFQIDGNFGGTAGVVEMLVQSSLKENYEAEVLLLPALPKEWSERGCLNGVRTRGGYSIDLVWRNGRPTSMSIQDIRPANSPTARLYVRFGKQKWTIKTKPGQKKRIL